MAESFTLEAQPRALTGKKVGALRRAGLVPVSIYGKRLNTPILLQVPYRPLQVALMKAGGTHLIEMDIDGKKHNVLAREVQRDVIRGDILHVDFIAVDADTRISTNVPIHFTGESSAVTRRIGVLGAGVTTLKIEALPADLPSVIEVDVSGLTELGDTLHVRDLKLSDRLTVLDNEDELIVRIAPLTTATAEDTPTEFTSAEPEVISKGKADEEDAK